MQVNDILFFLSFVLAFFLIWSFLKKRIVKQRATNEIWREFARMKGLQEQSAGKRGNDVSFDEDFNKTPDRSRSDDYGRVISLLGKNGDLPFVLECIATEGTPQRVGKFNISSGEGIRIFTRLRIGLDGLPEGFCAYRETAWSRLGKVVGMQDIVTGDSAFDKVFVVKGRDPMAVLGYLSPSRRTVLRDCAEMYPFLDLREGELLLMRPGQTDRMDQLEQYLADIGQLSSALHG